MKYLVELLKLEKESDIRLDYCDYIADCSNEEENIRTRILFDDVSGKYYYHQMQHGNVIKCFEIALDWKPSKNIYIFNYTPDDVHIYEIDSRRPDKFTILKLRPEQAQPGSECSYCGMTVRLESENSISFNGKSVEVIPDGEFIYRLLKTKIRASGGAKQLYIFLENIAANGNFAGYNEDVRIGDFVLMDFDRCNWLKFKRMYA